MAAVPNDNLTPPIVAVQRPITPKPKNADAMNDDEQDSDAVRAPPVDVAVPPPLLHAATTLVCNDWFVEV